MRVVLNYEPRNTVQFEHDYPMNYACDMFCRLIRGEVSYLAN